MPFDAYVGGWDSCGAASGLGVDRPGPTEVARWTVAMEEDEEELLIWYCELNKCWRSPAPLVDGILN